MKLNKTGIKDVLNCTCDLLKNAYGADIKQMKDEYIFRALGRIETLLSIIEVEE